MNECRMTRGFTLIDVIVGGGIDFKIQVRVNQLWRQLDFTNPLKINSIEMILIDEKVNAYI